LFAPKGRVARFCFWGDNDELSYAFVKTLNPNPAGSSLPAWLAWTANTGGTSGAANAELTIAGVGAAAGVYPFTGLIVALP